MKWKEVNYLDLFNIILDFSTNSEWTEGKVLEIQNLEEGLKPDRRLYITEHDLISNSTIDITLKYVSRTY